MSTGCEHTKLINVYTCLHVLLRKSLTAVELAVRLLYEWVYESLLEPNLQHRGWKVLEANDKDNNSV